MSAILCGKRSYFDDLPSASPPSSSKRIRCSSSSPVRYSTSPIHQLAALFPHMDTQVLEKVLEDCGDDLDSAIKRLNERLNEFRLTSLEKNLGPDDVVTANGEPQAQDNPSAQRSFPADGGEWIELFVQEMMNASNMDDARSRAARALEILEKSIVGRAAAEATENFTLDNEILKGQLDALVHENTILKRAVAIQHERQKDFENKSQELQHLKQLATQYQEQLRTLEVNNYALTMHLKQAQQNNSIPGRFNPDVF